MEEQKYMHVVAFNVPYPPDYGGIIDIYYKLKALHAAGYRVILHTFLYERGEAPELLDVCDAVHYYRRRQGLRYFFNRFPYIVITRQSDELEERLCADSHPVLFEGLHSTAAMEKCLDAGKKVLVRAHNIEHNYYSMLARSERNIFRKIFFIREAVKLRRHEQVLARAHAILAISTTDHHYFKGKYGNSTYVSAFHQHDEVLVPGGKGDYILFHGNLSVPENENAVRYLVQHVLSKVPFRVIIAGKNPSGYIRRLCDRHPHIELVPSPSAEQMNKLVTGAHINLLYTYQPTGLKLKLMHSLHTGRHCMANPLMLSGSNLESLCHVYRTPGEAVAMIGELMKISVDETEIKVREEKLDNYRNNLNVQKIISL